MAVFTLIPAAVAPLPGHTRTGAFYRDHWGKSDRRQSAGPRVRTAEGPHQRSGGSVLAGFWGAGWD